MLTVTTKTLSYWLLETLCSILKNKRLPETKYVSCNFHEIYASMQYLKK